MGSRGIRIAACLAQDFLSCFNALPDRHPGSRPVADDRLPRRERLSEGKPFRRFISNKK